MNQCKTQNIVAPLTQSATFLVFSIKGEQRESIETIKSTLGSTSDLIKNINIRDNTARFACTVGIGNKAWDCLFGQKGKPKELHAFKEVRGKKHVAVSTPGDLFYHIRSDRRDLCFEFERQLTDMLDDSVKVEDVTVGFRYFDTRDLLGFVDGTANPQDAEALEAAYITPSIDPSESAIGGSYVLIQKYKHDIKSWKTLSTEKQESILGRRKFDNVELEDADEKAQKSHKTLCTISASDGGERAILRDNMPFGSPAENMFGTYFIGYSRELWVMEKMLERMYCGDPDGLHDRTLDYSTPQTGSVFFAPSMDVLDSLGDD
ncbi:Dyp-type peroxidase [Meira miltonrushii]|uniref:Dyp-type peroxidase n=1 Tax=Meira miltonrushii TaxID=1280837 RepID=A0A316V7X6_9BASI|nr:Dyp-type peroxidase [Meira miltonrushii]PWN31555.1 Dyp-type peroxidase [Meira miltonrushii]